MKNCIFLCKFHRATKSNGDIILLKQKMYTTIYPQFCPVSATVRLLIRRNTTIYTLADREYLITYFECVSESLEHNTKSGTAENPPKMLFLAPEKKS